MMAAPVSPTDLQAIQSGSPASGVGGNEGVGRVVSVGSGVRVLKAGDWVVPAVAGLGTWRSQLVAPEASLARVRSNLPIEQAAMLASTCAAVRLLEDFAPLKKGDVIIQSGANGRVGNAVARIAAKRGIRAINVLRERGDWEAISSFLKTGGADIVINDKFLVSADYKKLVADLPAPSLALDCVGGKLGTDVARKLG